jgi:hypothetical protein
VSAALHHDFAQGVALAHTSVAAWDLIAYRLVRRLPTVLPALLCHA